MFAHPKEHLFFDLDHTLWDFERNARETLTELFFSYRFDKLLETSDASAFITTYNRNNQRLWAAYNLGQLDKTTLRKRRFADTFAELGLNPELFPLQFEQDYLSICPQKTHLFPNTHETLGYLKEKYTLHLISNGFREACTTKIQCSNLVQYFDSVVISEVIGILKPHPGIFHYAVTNARTSVTHSVMIGDNLEADIEGARNVGMDAIHFNPAPGANDPTDLPTIRDLSELRRFL